MSRINSPINNIIKSSDRNKYISRLEKNIGFKGNYKTPLYEKFIDKYEKINSIVPRKCLITFFSLFITCCVVLYVFKPRFIMKTLPNQKQFKISSNKEEIKVVSYWKLLIYSLIVSVILFLGMYMMRNKTKYLGMLF